MSKTIKQIADELGVSKQAVHQKRKSAALSTALQPFTTTVDGVVYIAPEGEMLIKQAFLKQDRPQPSTVDDNKFTPVDGNIDTPEHPLYVILKAELDAMHRQIEQLQEELAKERQHSREQAAELVKLADQAQRLHAGTMQAQLDAGGPLTEPEPDETAVTVPEPKRGFLHRCKNAWYALRR